MGFIIYSDIYNKNIKFMCNSSDENYNYEKWISHIQKMSLCRLTQSNLLSIAQVYILYLEQSSTIYIYGDADKGYDNTLGISV